MKNLFFIVATVCTLFLLSCKKERKQEVEDPRISVEVNAKGDSAVYGLATEGCSDTVVTILRNQGGDPVTYNILWATKHKMVFGKPKVGDRLALIRNGKDSLRADIVIDVDDLMGSWGYKMLPTVRPNIALAKAKGTLDEETDSILNALMKPEEYGFALKRQYVAHSLGTLRHITGDMDDCPVIYPQPRHYNEWRLYNGKLLLKEDAIQLPGVKRQKKQPPHIDTCEIVLLEKDSLALRLGTGTLGLYRKK